MIGQLIVPVSGTVFGAMAVAAGEPLGWLILGAALVLWVNMAWQHRPRGDSGRVSPRVAVALLAVIATFTASGCYPFNTTPFLVAGPAAPNGIVVHEGGYLADDCVFDLLIMGGTAVGLASIAPAGAVAVIASWSVVGGELGVTFNACVDMFERGGVKEHLTDHGLIGHCINVVYSAASCAVDGYVAFYGIVLAQTTLYADPITAVGVLLVLSSYGMKAWEGLRIL